MRVAISLLTLVPGISGGSETYARELTRSLARVGELEYRAFVPTLAPEAGGGLPTTVATDYPASSTTTGRLRAMGAATIRPGSLGRSLEAFDAVHYPLTVPVPRTRTPGLNRSERSAETGQSRSASSRSVRHSDGPEPPPGSAPDRRTSCRNRSRSAATSTGRAESVSPEIPAESSIFSPPADIAAF